MVTSPRVSTGVNSGNDALLRRHVRPGCPLLGVDAALQRPRGLARGRAELRLSLPVTPLLRGPLPRCWVTPRHPVDFCHTEHLPQVVLIVFIHLLSCLLAIPHHPLLPSVGRKQHGPSGPTSYSVLSPELLELGLAQRGLSVNIY